MIFSEKMNVIYKGLLGTIDFICDDYLVLEVSTNPEQTPARLIIYRKYYSEISIPKASTK
jgi:hypothetical protein